MEPGAQKTSALWADGDNCISSVSYSEVAAKLSERGIPKHEISIVLEAIPLRVMDFDEPLALETGLIRKTAKSLRLSLGDRACLAVGKQLDAEIVTADTLWKKLGEFKITTVR
jgi:ribonuclease VapC